MFYEKLIKKLKKSKAEVAVVGVGYVGLPLAAEFAQKGLKVYGLDVSEEKVELLRKGVSYIQDVESSDLAALVNSGNFIPETNFKVMEKADAVIICVPTPLRKSREPDMSYIISASRSVASNISRGTLVVLESTTYPGTTREILAPELEKRGFNVGENVFLAFSPERVDPGNKEYGIRNTPKVIGGVDKKSLELARALYETAVDNVVCVDSCEEAEMVKLLENTFRAVNIGLINEMAQLCNKFGLDVWRIVKAASSKPFGFMPFYPGPGMGGHCLPTDPQFLSWKAKSSRFYPHFIDYAEEINRAMPSFVVSRISNVLNRYSKSVNGSSILIMGVSYKKNIGDVREAPAYDIIAELKELGAELSYCDPYVDEFEGVEGVDHAATDYGSYDCTVIITDHDDFNYKDIVNKAGLVFDCRGVTLGLEGKAFIERL
ncbi:MAG: nucleotide sugar dehydrogenase [Elusimicrobiota bacterium]